MKLTTKLINLIVLIMISTFIYAQDVDVPNSLGNEKEASSDDRTYRIGVEFTPDFGTFSSSTTGYTSSGGEIGYKFGVLLERFLTQNYVFSSGLFLGNHGGEIAHNGAYKSNNTFSATAVNSAYELRYIEIPLHLKLRTNEIGAFRYLVFFGADVAFRYGAVNDIEYKDINGGILREDENVTSETFLFNPSLTFGIGAEYNLVGNTNAYLGFSYTKGLFSPLDFKAYEYDANNRLIFNNGIPKESAKNVSATLNYFALHFAVFF